jgi:hypothetical protein
MYACRPEGFTEDVVLLAPDDFNVNGPWPHPCQGLQVWRGLPRAAHAPPPPMACTGVHLSSLLGRELFTVLCGSHTQLAVHRPCAAPVHRSEQGQCSQLLVALRMPVRSAHACI